MASRREILAAGLACYYADGNRDSVERPHCTKVAVVAYGPTVLCAMCGAMASAVGRTNVARKVPGAELSELVEAAVALERAEERLADAVLSARVAGASWGQVGDAMSITRQAAQHRFGPKAPLSAKLIAKEPNTPAVK